MTPQSRAEELPRLSGETRGWDRTANIPDAEETGYWEPGTRD